MKKIYGILPSLASGGAERQLLVLLEQLGCRGYDVCLVTYVVSKDAYEVPKNVKRMRIHGRGKIQDRWNLARFMWSEVRNGLRKGLRENYYLHGREWPYRDVSRRIIAEQYLEEENSQLKTNENITVGNLRDYKFYCFNGSPRLCQVISDRATDEKIDFYDMEWHRLVGLVGLVGLTENAHNSKQDITCPKSFAEMKKCAGILSKGIPFSRIDFYDIDGRAYWGEITFFPASGIGKFYPEEWNEIIGNWITLPVKH